MANLVFWTTSAPNPLSDELILAGHCVWEALVYSEVTALIQGHNPDLIVVDYGVPLGRQRASSLGRVCILREPTTTAQQLIWEIDQLIPRASSIQ